MISLFCLFNFYRYGDYSQRQLEDLESFCVENAKDVADWDRWYSDRENTGTHECMQTALKLINKDALSEVLRDRNIDKNSKHDFALLIAEIKRALNQHTPPQFDPTHPTLSGALLSAFNHASLWHVLGNLWVFLIFAMVLEHIMGPAKYATLVLAVILSESLVYWIIVRVGLLPGLPSLGLSGVVYAFIAAAVQLLPTAKVRVLYFALRIYNFEVPVTWFAALYFFTEIGVLILGNENLGGHLAHLTGFVVAYFLSPVLWQERISSVPRKSPDAF